MLRSVTLDEIAGVLGGEEAERLTGVCRFEDILPLRQCRKKSLLPENLKSVIVRLFPYHADGLENRNVARYACLSDYHRVCGGLLQELTDRLSDKYPGEEFVPFIDDSPVPEVRAAYLAGLGSIGMHGMLIHEQYGSRVFIGAIVTTLEIEPSANTQKACLNCGRCVAACPTGALENGKPLNKERCRSHITQKKGPLTDWETAQIKDGGFVWGCDICADVCPLNQNLPITPVMEFRENVVPVLTRENLDAAITDKPYAWRGKDVLLRNIGILEAKADG